MLRYINATGTIRSDDAKIKLRRDARLSYVATGIYMCVQETIESTAECIDCIL